MLRPPHRDEADADDTETAKQIREDPGDAIESAIERHRQEVLAAVLRNPLVDDLIVSLASVDVRAKVGSHLRGLAADALRQRLVCAAAARARDLVAHLLLEVVLRRVER